MSTKNIILQKSGFSTTIEKDGGDTIDVTLQALHTGIFFDMNGTEVIIDEPYLKAICDNYNESVELAYNIDKETDPTIANIKLEEFDNRNAPNQINHDATDINATVGHVIGFMKCKEINDKLYLYCTVRVKGAENVTKVRDKRFRNVSMQFDPETKRFVEVSWVVVGAAYEAHSMLSKPQNCPQMSETFGKAIAKIQLRQDDIACMKRELEATKHLIALSKRGLMNRAQINNIKPQLAQFNNPKAVIELLEYVLPNKTFKPTFINKDGKDKAIMEKLYEGMKMATQQTKTNYESLDDALSNVALAGDLTGIEHAYVGNDNSLATYDEDMALKHRQLMEMSMGGYESGDMEMGRKYGEMAKKLSDEIKAGRAKLSDYDVEEDSKDSKEVKELAKKIKAAEEDVKKDVSEKLAAFEDKINVLLSQSQPTTSIQSEIKDIKDAIVLLTKLQAGGTK